MTASSWMVVALVLLGGALDDNKPFQEGVGLYQELEFEQAIFRFEEAALDPGLTEKERALVFGWMAMAYAGRGDAEASKRSLRNALLKDPEVTLPGVAPPKVKGWLEEVRASLGPTPLAAEGASASEGASDPASATELGSPEARAPSSSGDGERAPVGRRSNAPLESVQELTIVPEEPAEEGGGGVLVGLLMMGSGAGAMLLGAVLAVPAALFFFDYYVITQQFLPQIQADIDSGTLSPGQVADREALRGQYEQAANNDLIGGGAFAIPGAVIAVVGVALLAVGAGTAAWSSME